MEDVFRKHDRVRVTPMFSPALLGVVDRITALYVWVVIDGTRAARSYLPKFVEKVRREDFPLPHRRRVRLQARAR